MFGVGRLVLAAARVEVAEGVAVSGQGNAGPSYAGGELQGVIRVVGVPLVDVGFDDRWDDDLGSFEDEFALKARTRAKDMFRRRR